MPTGDIPAQRAALEREIELARQQHAIVNKQVAVGRATTEESIKAEREILRLQRELAALPGSSNDAPKGPLRITVVGAPARLVLLVYPNYFPKDRIPPEHQADPNVVIGTVLLSEVFARTHPLGPTVKATAVEVQRFVDGDRKSWRLDPDGEEARKFELQDGDLLTLSKKAFVF